MIFASSEEQVIEMHMLQFQTGIQCHKRLKNPFAGINVIMNLYGGARVSERKKASQDMKCIRYIQES